MAANDQTQAPKQQQQQQQAAPPPAVAAMPYIPTAEEEAYLAECGKAITAGSDAATTAAAAANGAAFSEFATGVKALTDAYTAIKHGGNVSRHQGS